MVKEAIDPSGSVPPNPGTGVVVLGPMVKLAFVATGGWLFGVGVGDAVAAKVAVAGLVAPLLSVAL